MRWTLILLLLILIQVAQAGTDLRIFAENVTLQRNNRYEGENITLNLTVENNGTESITGVVIKTKHNEEDISNYTVGILGNSSIILNASFVSVIGNNTFRIIIDPNDTISEDSESNNNETMFLNVSAYQTLAGKVTESFFVGLGKFTLFEYGSRNLHNVLIVDSDSNVDFSALQALGRNITGDNQSNDFKEADTIMNMTGFNDSLDALYMDGPKIKENRTFNVLGVPILNVPVINNSVGSTNVTGVLYDTSDHVKSAGDQGFDLEDSEDLVFITSISSENYELFFPALLRNFTGSTETVTFYLD